MCTSMAEPSTGHDLRALHAEVCSSDPELQLEATRQIRKLLSIQDVLTNIALVIDSGVLPRFVEFLSYHHNPELQFEAAWAITNTAGGSSSETQAVVSAGALPPLVELLSLSNERIKIQAVWALGNIAGDGPELQRRVIEYGHTVTQPLLGLLNDHRLLVTHTNVVVWTVSRLCKCDDDGECPPFEVVRQFIPALAQILTRFSVGEDPLYNDPQFLQMVIHQDAALFAPFLESLSQDNPQILDLISQNQPELLRIFLEPTACELLNSSCWALYYFQRQIPAGNALVIDEMLKSNVVPSILPLLNHYDYKVAKIALKLIGYIANGNDFQIQSLLDHNILPILGVLLLGQNPLLEKYAGIVVANILTGNSSQIQVVLETLLAHIIYNLQKTNTKVQKEMKYAVRNMITHGTAEQIRLVEELLLPVLRSVSTSGELQEIFGWRIGPTARLLSSCNGLLSPDPEEQLNAMRQIRKFLQGNKPDRCTNITLVVQTGLVPLIVQFLCHQKQHGLVITNIAYGSSNQTKMVMEAGAIPALVGLLSTSQVERVTEQAAWALANIAGDGPVFRQQVVLNGVVDALIGWLKKPNLPDSSVKIAAWTICNLCRSDIKLSSSPIEEVKQFIPALVQLACYPDPEVLKNACWALYCMTHQRTATDVVEEMVQAGIVPCLAQLLGHLDQGVINTALNVLINITAGNDAQRQTVIDHGVLESLGSLLYYPNEKIQASAGWVLSNILGGTVGQVQAVLDGNLLEPILQVFQAGEFTVQQQLKTAVVNLLTCGTPQQIQFAEDRGLIRIMQLVLTPDEYQETLSRHNGKACPEVVEDEIEQLRKRLKDI